MAASRITDHVARAIARIPSQLRGKPKFEALVSLLVAPVQAVEDALWALLSERTLDVAVGAQLDAFGKLVGRARAGLDDDTYRRYLAAEIRTHKSRGTVNELLTIVDLALDDDTAVVVIQRAMGAATVVHISIAVVSHALAAVLVGFLRKAIGGGVRLVLEYSDVVDGEVFYWDTGHWDSGEIYATAVE